MPSSGDHELVRQRVDAATVLMPNELKPAALGGAQVELEIGIGRNGLVQIGDEHVVSVITQTNLLMILRGMTLPSLSWRRPVSI